MHLAHRGIASTTGEPLLRTLEADSPCTHVRPRSPYATATAHPTALCCAATCCAVLRALASHVSYRCAAGCMRRAAGAFAPTHARSLMTQLAEAVPNASMRLYGGAQFHRAMTEFR